VLKSKGLGSDGTMKSLEESQYEVTRRIIYGNEATTQ